MHETLSTMMAGRVFLFSNNLGIMLIAISIFCINITLVLIHPIISLVCG